MFTQMRARGNLQSPLEVHLGQRTRQHDSQEVDTAMAMLTAYDPFAATNSAFRLLDQLSGRTGTARPLSGMPMDAYKVGDHFVAHFDLPGVDPGSIDLSIEGQTLTVTAERSVPQLENAEWSVAERPYGSYTRQLVLGRSLDTDRLEASYHDGVLTVSIPVAEKARSRKIQVTRADAPASVEGRTIEHENPAVEA